MAHAINSAWQYIRQPWRLAVFFKRLLLFVGFLILVFFVSKWAFNNLRTSQHRVVSVVTLWLVIAYYALPRVHRILSRIYVPHYFIGRARTSDGLLADPVNLALRGTRAQLVRAMKNAGWQQADPVTISTSLRIIGATLRRVSYPNAPVSDLFVFGRKQTLAFQKEVDGNPAKRHHVRFWRLNKKTYLPGGYDVDWVAAATYDDAVGFSLFTLQITHRIAGDVDKERNFVVTTLKDAGGVGKIKHIDRFFPGYAHRNGGGDSFFTDGSIVIVDLKDAPQ